MKGLYDLFMLPLEKSGIRKARINLIKKVNGVVLEIGSGSGANTPYYNFNNIEKLVLTDKKLSKKLKSNIDKIEILEVDALQLPFADGIFDFVVGSLVFCSVKNPLKGLEEVYRVLKDEGRFIYIEHVLPKGNVLSRIFKLINPFWRRVSGGCNLNRNFLSTLKNAGFVVADNMTFGKKIFVAGYAKKSID